MAGTEIATLDDAELRRRGDFLDAVRAGTPVEIAAYEVGWSPRVFQRLMDDDEFAELVEIHASLRDAAVEKVLYERALAGNQRAMEMWLLNRRPDRWKDTKSLKIEGDTSTAPEIIAATAAAIRATVLDLAKERNIQALQAPVPSYIEVGPGDDSE